MNKTENPLKKLIDSNIYTRYSGILSLSDISLFLVDTDGEILLEFIPSPDFCTHVCQERGGQICQDYRCRFKAGEEGSFVCRHGLENILFPINVQDETVGYIAGMQVYLQDTEYQKYMIDVQSLKNDKSPELEFIAKSISSLKTVETNKIKVHEQLCAHIAKNISLDLSEIVSHADPDVARLSIEKEILEKKIIDLEAKNMSLVINPHFLFNTLNCIARIAYFEHSHTTEELIYCLSDLLRYNLKQDDQLHTIGSEIDNIEKYLHIQKVRFKNRLEYEIDVPDNIKTYRIPNMVIQPIVENALIHGITPKRDGGKISIFAEKYNNEIVISIMDNGNGFPKDVLENIKHSENKSGLGFRSTDKRLKQYYGEQYGLEIVKSDYSGSTVTITIPTQPIGR
ncbi:histidine kinase [Sinanaerobacter chloroacetimidivorans]|jgi:signal transduction histidine kinase|uniref:Histidine kinase n=1 Tax=Sinanaerobacter chloroacetimidivorans TaxID=2818044 RepID=A0A8J7W1C2_9FIRM|nr:histidine kinase [Sinanaerobacter chloroacetimidivorans]MBR0597390.1 histidine kinase [Sinanaerobacter chloroacetimidivorans]